MNFRWVFRFLALFLIAGALLFVPMPGHTGHDATALVSVEDSADGHGHDHDHPHLPGHDAADHSHQVLFMADSVMQRPFAAASAWRLMASRLPESTIPSGLERPPRQV